MNLPLKPEELEPIGQESKEIFGALNKNSGTCASCKDETEAISELPEKTRTLGLALK